MTENYAPTAPTAPPAASNATNAGAGHRTLLSARLTQSVTLSDATRHLEFTLVDSDEFRFIPGQFVSIVQPKPDGRVHTRAYSLASAPSADNRFELCLNRVPGGIFSGPLFELKPGETVEMKPPLGMFVLRQPPRDSLLIATGTGIAPFRSMLLANLKEDSPQFILLFGVRYESHLMYRSEFEGMALGYPRFRFWPTLSRPERDWPPHCNFGPG